MRYPYDPGRATAIVEGLGYTRGPDGRLVDQSGQRIQIEFRASEGNPLNVQTAFPVADFWTRIGVDIEMVIIPTQRLADREYRFTFPAFELVGTGLGGLNSNTMSRVLSSNTPLPENNYVGGNRSRYRSPEFDRMIERYITTIPMAQRLDALGDILNHETVNLLYLPLFFTGEANVLGSIRLKGVTSGRVWNAHLWDVVNAR
jgi:peptide/nickel transport system substrate-binding protein